MKMNIFTIQETYFLTFDYVSVRNIIIGIESKPVKDTPCIVKISILIQTFFYI